LRALPKEEVFDLAFIDADKTNYATYYEEILLRMRRNGLILVDNVLWMGNVVKDDAQDPNTVALRAFNARVASDARVECVMLPVADGLTILRKR
jgi:caffeoyl-CoA O-methyltransferase